jgi:zinc transport system substrate-binding protein
MEMRYFAHNFRAIRRKFSLAILFGLAVGLDSCASGSVPSGNTESSQGKSPSANGAAIQVVTTFLPITQFTKAVAGDRAQVTQLLPSNIGPHDYQSKPGDVQILAQADVLVQNGLEIEEFLENLVKNAENSKLKTIDTSRGIKTIASEAVEGHEEKRHTEDKKAEAGHAHGEFNPHIWLDPKRVIQQVENIRDGLVTADPAGKETYTANATAYIEKLKILDRDISTVLKPYSGRTFVAYHDFAPYFAQSYNLKAQFLVDVPEENPSPEDVKRIVKTVKDSNLKTLLTEPQVGESSFASLSGDLKIKVGLFEPMETGVIEGTAPDYYVTTMRKNLKSLKTAFEGSI